MSAVPSSVAAVSTMHLVVPASSRLLILASSETSKERTSRPLPLHLLSQLLRQGMARSKEFLCQQALFHMFICGTQHEDAVLLARRTEEVFISTISFSLYPVHLFSGPVPIDELANLVSVSYRSEIPSRARDTSDISTQGIEILQIWMSCLSHT